MTATGDTRYEAIALTRQGYALNRLGDRARADDAFIRAHALHQKMEQHNRSMAPLAGMARVAEARDGAEALEYARRIGVHLQTYTLDRTIEGCRVYLTCYRILAQSPSEEDRTAALQVLQTIYAQLQRREATIDDPAWRHSFRQVPEHEAVRRAASDTV